MLNHIKEANRNYVSFDDRMARKLATEDPSLFFETYKPPILIDEFQKVLRFEKKLKILWIRFLIKEKIVTDIFG